MKVYCYPADRDSAYVPLLFAGIENDYEPIFRQDGSLRDAIAELADGRVVVVHVHWEEFVLRDCRDEDGADAAATAFEREIEAVRDRGGAIVWTVHNEWPHEIPYRHQFLRMRRALARHADAVLLHDAASRDVLAAQVTLDPSRVRLLPHPSYLGRHEDEATLRAGLDASPERRIQAFGWIRLQKGFGPMIDMLTADFLQSRNADLRISGSGTEAAAAIAEHTRRRDVQWDVRHVPDAEVPQLLRSATCVVVPYERVLTSGVALLAMSVGAMLVAVDRPQVRELLPPASRRFLYPPGDAHALRRAIDEVFALSVTERRAMLEANLAVAEGRRPTLVAQRLAAIYRDVTATAERFRTAHT